MRDIKFRSWHKYAKSMEEVTALFLDPESYNFVETVCHIEDPEGHSEEYKKDQVVLMQYTGLKDKNGKEIFERDIVKFDEKTGLPPREIKFLKNGVNLKQSSISREGIAHGVEVIGNIYENPDLVPKINSN